MRIWVGVGFTGGGVWVVGFWGGGAAGFWGGWVKGGGLVGFGGDVWVPIGGHGGQSGQEARGKGRGWDARGRRNVVLAGMKSCRRS
jgi:hypothetical protein